MANMAKKLQSAKAARSGDGRGRSAGKHADAPTTDNNHQKTVSGRNQKGPADKRGKTGGGNEGSKGQNRRRASPRGSIGSHKPGGDGPGTKKFKYEADDNNRRRKES
jgi:hypothetical protein